MPRSPLEIFSALVPVDRGVERVADGVAYGPHPRHRLDIYRPVDAASELPVLVFANSLRGRRRGGNRLGSGAG